jgi:pimeloyl-ACP methyl ester carboxylesterase
MKKSLGSLYILTVLRRGINACLVLLLSLAPFSYGSTVWRDESPHTEKLVSANGVQLESLDWGGHGRTLLFLAGLGCTGHIFDQLAPHFTNDFHVIALTRRGFGGSDKPAEGYDSTNLVKDIAAFLDGLRLEQVILAGHSLAGQEMTRFASEHPNRVDSLIYLDAAYDYSVEPAVIMRFQALLPRPTKDDESSFANLLRWHKKNLPGWNAACENDFRATRAREGDEYTARDATPDAIQGALIQGLVLSGPPDFTKVHARALAIYTDHDLERFRSRASSPNLEAKEAVDTLIEWQKQQKTLFHERVKGSQIVTLEHTDHFCFIEREADVVREMRKFLE